MILSPRTRKILIPAGIAALILIAWRSMGTPGVLAISGGVLMWLLLHFTRVMAVMRRAAARPLGYVDSAVMLNARLRPGQTLLHIVALTRSLGETLSAPAPDGPPAHQESYRWRDAGGASITCHFQDGHLTHWHMQRGPEDTPPTPTAAAPSA